MFVHFYTEEIHKLFLKIKFARASVSHSMNSKCWESAVSVITPSPIFPSSCELRSQQVGSCLSLDPSANWVSPEGK